MVKNDPELVKTALKNRGFYGTNGTWNSLIKKDGKLFRERVETIVIRNRKEVYLLKHHDGEYSLPGGSTEKDKTKAEQAIAECEEEARLRVKNIKDSGKTVTFLNEQEYKWVVEQPISWDGKISYVFVGEYDGKYTGFIKKVDRDNRMLKSGKWYPIKDCQKFMKKEHLEALHDYLNSTKDTDSGDVVEESYVVNYFKNRKLLKSLSKNAKPEDSRKHMVYCIREITKKYDKLKNTSKVRKISKDEKKRQTRFFPVLSQTFNYNKQQYEVTYVLQFNPESFTAAAAMTTEKYGNLVFIYPSFFTLNIDSQIFLLLHEVGHVVLGHIYPENMPRLVPIIGERDPEKYRNKMMLKDKVMYPEYYADLFAIINGAKLYSILDISHKEDLDDEYDYRYTNQELANRYKQVMRDMNRLQYSAEAVDIEGFQMETKITTHFDLMGESVIIESADVSNPYIYTLFTEEKYEDCPYNEFGIPQTRSYPLNTKKRVYSACKLFGHCPEKYRVELAKRIFSAMRRYDIPKDYIGERSRLYGYIKYW